MREGGLPALIWATRGRHWGFRFLLDGGLDDPLPLYRRVFADAEQSSEVFTSDGALVGVRFSDPEGRRDSAGRAIPHEFVALDDLASKISDVKDGVAVVWPIVSSAYASAWLAAEPPVLDSTTSSLNW